MKGLTVKRAEGALLRIAEWQLWHLAQAVGPALRARNYRALRRAVAGYESLTDEKLQGVANGSRVFGKRTWIISMATDPSICPQTDGKVLVSAEIADLVLNVRRVLAAAVRVN